MRLWLLRHPRRERGEPYVRPLLCEALGCDDDALPLSRGSEGRPLLGPPYQRFDAGWSHSGDALLLALGESIQLGVDHRTTPAASARTATGAAILPSRRSALAGRPGRKTAMEFSFVRLWCAKEAVLKAHGKGLSFGLDKLVFAENGDDLQLIRCDFRAGAAAGVDAARVDALARLSRRAGWRTS